MNLHPVIYVPVSVEDELPPFNKDVAVITDCSKIRTSCIMSDGKFDDYNFTCDDDEKVTHWLRPIQNVYVVSEEEIDGWISVNTEPVNYSTIEAKTNCGHISNADVNAAKNILSKGIALSRKRELISCALALESESSDIPAIN